jgi:hypothetical protein
VHQPVRFENESIVDGNPGRFVMRRLAAAVALALPLCANADFVRVEYEGVVNDVRRTVCNACDPTRDYGPDHPEFTRYSVGDRVHGLLMIDLAAAPPDVRPLDPTTGIYPARSRSGGYISGNGAPLVHLVLQDSVSVNDWEEGESFEHYIVTDQWRSANGTGQMGVNVISRRAGIDLNTGDGIAQDIDVTARSGLQLTGYISKVVRGVKGSVSVFASLVFDRVKVSSPGQCRA